jgi:hypothetical protein
MNDAVHQGSCLCGAIRFTIKGDLHAPDACHCGQCRKQSGHFWASTDVKRAALTIEGEDNLRWFNASAQARRGFCATCGSFLFWEPTGQDRVAVGMGTIDAPTNTRLAMHIFVANQGDYYDIADDLPQHR